MKHRYATFLTAVCLLFSAGQSSAQTFRRVTNLPHIYINTANSQSITSKTNYIYATMRYVDENDSVTRYDSLQIRGRGNSTWNLSKKPYRIKFQTKEKFLGKGYAKAKKWTLLANAADKTLIRNAVTSELGEWLGLKFNPAARFVDLTLNGTFMGNYQISDQVEVRAHRVNVTEQDYPLADTSDISGGYLLEVDGFQDGNCFTTQQAAAPVRIHYPDEDEIAASQNTYIKDYVNGFEAALYGNDAQDAENGYRAWVDSTSLANWYIATEVSANVDGFYSTYFYKDQQNPLLYFGPLWDYDIAYGNDYRKGDTSQSLMSDVGYGQTRLWVNEMWKDPWFARLVNRRYGQVIDSGLTDFMLAKVDSLDELLQASQTLNYNKWGINTRAYHEIVIYSSYDQYITDLKDFITTHNQYLLTAFADKKPAEPTPAFAAGPYYYRITSARSAKAFELKAADGTSGFSEDNQPAAGTLVCTWENDADRLSEEWRFTPVGDYFFIQNRLGGLALSDPTGDPVTATTNTGTQLSVAEPDSTDERQLWTLTPQGTAGYYNFINLHSQHAANLKGGGTVDGTDVVSYTSDSRNATSTNRLWYIIPSSDLPADTAVVDTTEADGIRGVQAVEPDEYALAYDPQQRLLHFASETPERLTFTATIHTLSGLRQRSFKASEPCSVADLPGGIYIVSWHVGGHTRSAKFVIP